MKKIVILLFLIIAFFNPSIICAKTYEVEATGEYVMGDRDTKADARLIALEHAKLLAVEQIGTYLEAERVVADNQLTKNEIRTYASAIVKTVVLSEDIRLLQNKTTIFSLNIRATVDISVLENKIKEIKSDSKRNQQISALQSENIRLLKDLESLSGKLKNERTGHYRKLIQDRENVLEKLEKNQKSIRIAFEEGTLLHLSMKNRDELEENKKNIDRALQFIADNTVFTLGQPQIRNKGSISDLIIHVEWRVQKADELLNIIESFHEKSKLNAFYEIPVSSPCFNGINKETLAAYFESRMVRLKIQVGKWHESVDVIDNVDNVNYIKTRKKTLLTIPDIPTDQLDQITGIECRVVAEPIDGQIAAGR